MTEPVGQGDRRIDEASDIVHLLRSDSRRLSLGAIRFAFRVGNYVHVERAYGLEVAQTAMKRLCGILADIFRNDAIATLEGNDVVGVVLPNPVALGPEITPIICDSWGLAVCESIALTPIQTSEGPLHLALSGIWVGGQQNSDTHRRIPIDLLVEGAFKPAFAGKAPGGGTSWGVRYRADMALVATALASVDRAVDDVMVSLDGRQVRCRFMLDWQAVRDARSPEKILYHEALLRLLDDRGERHSAFALIAGLERLGFCRHFDRFVVRSVVEELQVSSTVVLGVNISAQSASDIASWDEILAILRSDPAIGPRLILEITGSSAFPDISGAVSFAQKMRSLGVSIALDDFGAGFTSVRQLLALSPRIIKIDPTFLRRASASSADRTIFNHLVGLAGASPVIVVDEVENDEQARIALEAGVTWQQGLHWGAPRACRAWRNTEPAKASAEVVPFVSGSGGRFDGILRHTGSDVGDAA